MTGKPTSNLDLTLRKKGGEWFIGTKNAKELIRKAVKDGLIIHPRKENEHDEHKQDTKTGAHGKG